MLWLHLNPTPTLHLYLHPTRDFICILHCDFTPILHVTSFVSYTVASPISPGGWKDPTRGAAWGVGPVQDCTDNLPQNWTGLYHTSALHCTALKLNVLDCTALNKTKWDCIAKYCTKTAMHCTLLNLHHKYPHCTVLRSTYMNCPALQYSVHWTSLNCTVLHCDEPNYTEFTDCT